jgi:TonB-linked SusC/RagA family outer membrane protein
MNSLLIKKTIRHQYAVKVVNIMRIYILLVIIGVTQALGMNSYSQTALINLYMDNTTVEDVINGIEEQSEFRFLYNKKIVNVENKVSIKASNENIIAVLDNLFRDADISYAISDRQIVLNRKDVFLAALPAIARETGKRITGTVTDLNGEPVIGANITEKGISNGTVTDVEGNFSLTVKDDAILQVSYIGYITQEISVLRLVGEMPLIIKLLEDTRTLEEIVVVGYGTVKKRDLTGSVGSINAEKISLTPATNVTQAMQGRIAGLLINVSSNQPGSSPSVLVRGKRSISGGSDPLYVVDGIAITGGLTEINPVDIESIDVLKDASATAIYGARGSNGVIMITTKKGREGKSIVEYNGYAGFESVLNELEYMDGGEFTEYVRESYRANGKYPSDKPSWELDQQIPTFKNDPYTLESVHMGYDANGNFDPSKVRSDSKWWEAIKRRGFITNHQVSVRGGNEKTLFNFSATYFNEKSLMKDEAYTRTSLRSNLDHTVNSWLKVGANSQFAHSVQDRGASLYDAWRLIPIGRLYDDDGNVLLMVSGTDDQYWNPMTRLEPGARVVPYKVNNFMGSYYAEIKLPLEGLRFRSNLGLNLRAIQDYEFQAAITRGKTTMNYAKNATGNQYSYLWENLLYYDKQIGKHNFGVTFLQSVQEYLNESNSIPVQDTPSDMLLYYDVASASTPGAIDSNKQQWNLASFMGRVNYSFNDRYLLTVSARYDGASRLAAGHQWVMFPAASLAWRIKEENFAKDLQALSNLKLRLGYGTTASSEVTPYETKGTLQKMYYTFGSNKLIGYAPDRMPNTTLTWETTGQWNLGLDFGFLRNRISGVIDVYLQNTENLLLDRQLPVVSGFEVIRSNIGRTRNKGIEFTLNTVNIERKNFNWTTDWMLYTNREEIVELYNGKIDDPGNSWFIGEAINVYYNYKKVGIWQDTPEDNAEMAKFNANGSNFRVGSIKLWDDGDYRITPDDRVIQGKARPSVIASLNNSFRYRDFDFSFYFMIHQGAMINNNLSLLNQGMRNGNVKVNYWTPTNPSNDAPRPIEGIDFLDYYYTLNYQKADFVKLKNVTLGYTLPNRFTGRFGISRLRLYCQAQNPWMWTNFEGVDPEGAGGYTRPTPSTWLMGLNVSF